MLKTLFSICIRRYICADVEVIILFSLCQPFYLLLLCFFILAIHFVILFKRMNVHLSLEVDMERL